MLCLAVNAKYDKLEAEGIAGLGQAADILVKHPFRLNSILAEEGVRDGIGIDITDGVQEKFVHGGIVRPSVEVLVLVEEIDQLFGCGGSVCHSKLLQAYSASAGGIFRYALR